MNNIWRKPVGFNMIEIRPKLYQFLFEREADMRRVLKGNPWTFRNAWLLVKKWERSINPMDMNFSRHDEVSCEKREAEEDSGRAKSKELGPWLREEITGTKMEQSGPQKQTEKRRLVARAKGITQAGKRDVIEKRAELTVKEPITSIEKKVEQNQG
ncbi:hypothetical protein Ahy_B05g074242 [Arachis hypogaea]|uniref:DUF4283 domain-containing protein n=1 Tax=Arachis hypogaea TaxID=3818 RepID=A0A444YYE8_ARAHY|nr:hypothetical protein Ahy_B05g074242 [Arachis hypogaea]